jgi:predicted NACHT family NTPase
MVGLDLLAIWGVKTAGSFLLQPVLTDLAKDLGKDTAKDLVKDWLKAGIGKIVKLPEQDEYKEAIGKAVKVFTELVEDELIDRNVDESGIRAYTPAIVELLKVPAVRTALGGVFIEDAPSCDLRILIGVWKEKQLEPLPADFNWERLGKLYLRKSPGIINEVPKLKAAFSMSVQRQMLESIQSIAGVSPNFDRDKYARGLLDRYREPKLTQDAVSTVYGCLQPIQLWDVFIPQNVRNCDRFIPQIHELPQQYRTQSGSEEPLQLEPIEDLRRVYWEQKTQGVLEAIADSKTRSVILGDPGSGKSSLLQYLALTWAKKTTTERYQERLPLFAELRLYGDDKERGNCKGLLDFFHQGNTFCHLDRQELDRELKAGQVIALFDGLDEVFDPKLRSEITTDIYRFSTNYPNVQIIVSSRWLGYKQEILTGANFQHLMLQDLDLATQVPDFINRWHQFAFNDPTEGEKRRKILLETIQNTHNKAIRELAGNPLLLTLMAIINRSQTLPKERFKLYEQASELLLHKWDADIHELQDPDLERIDLRHKQEILRRVAYQMQTESADAHTNLISEENLERIVREYLESIKYPDPFNGTNKIIDRLRVRNFMLCSLGGNYFAFVHRTFAEYFCAYDLFKKCTGINRQLSLDDLQSKYFGRYWANENWHEILRLLVGLLSSDDDNNINAIKSIMKHLLKRDGKDCDYLNVFLAADFLMEVRNRQLYSQVDGATLNRLGKLAKLSLGNLISHNACNSIGIVWQGEESGCKKLQELSNQGNHPAMFALARHYRDELDTHSIIKQSATKGDYAGISALARHYRDELDTHSIVKQSATQGNNNGHAILSLAEYYRDELDTHSIVKQSATKGDYAGISALAKHYRDELDTYSIVKQSAIKGNFPAIYALVGHYRDELDTHSIVKQLAIQGNGHAIYVLVGHYRDELDTHSIVKKLATQGDHTAIYVLVGHYRDELDTHSIVKKFALQGNSTAIYALAKYYQDEPGTRSSSNSLTNRIARIWTLIKRL